MKKRMVSMMMAGVMVLSLAGCGGAAKTAETAAQTEAPSSAAETTAAETTVAETTAAETTAAGGKFTVGFDQDFPPMGFVGEDGTHVGFDIDLAKEVAARLGVELVLQPIDWDSKELELSGGNIDCIWSGLTITEERKEQMLFTMPYLANEQIMVVMADSGIASMADLAGKVLGTQAGSASVDVLEANPELKASLAEIALSDDFVAALMDLKLGGIDVLLIDSVVGNYYISQQDDPDAFSVLPEVLEAEEYGIAFRLGEQTLADAVSEQLIAMSEDGTLDAIRANWFANDITIVSKYADSYGK